MVTRHIRPQPNSPTSVRLPYVCVYVCLPARLTKVTTGSAVQYLRSLFLLPAKADRVGRPCAHPHLTHSDENPPLTNASCRQLVGLGLVMSRIAKPPHGREWHATLPSVYTSGQFRRRGRIDRSKPTVGSSTSRRWMTGGRPNHGPGVCMGVSPCAGGGFVRIVAKTIEQSMGRSADLIVMVKNVMHDP
jgi:hypothetical protein